MRPHLLALALVAALAGCQPADAPTNASTPAASQQTSAVLGTSAGIVLMVALIVLAYLRYLPAWVALLRSGKPYAFSIAAALVSIPLSILIDGALRVLHKEMGLPMSDGIKHFFLSFEEVLEMCIPLMLLWAFLQFHAEKTNSKSLTERDSPPAGPIPDR